jgi:cobalt-precorrin-5B (C1)-methyltransferase
MSVESKLRTGFTTGAAAAAAAKAAAIALYKKERPGHVTVRNPDGKELRIPIHRYINQEDGKGATVIKDGGDDPDATHGLEIIATVVATNNGAIVIKGGEGVGTVTKPGLQVPVGRPAINPVPAWMIKTALAEIMPAGTGCTVTIRVPDGEKIARRTLNPRLGIVGGISILGTTGIVHPMSEEAYKNSLVPLIDMAVALGYSSVVLTPGRLGAKWAVSRGIPEPAVVEMSNFVGFMLEKCVEKGIKKVLLWGHHGKLVKVAAGIFHTHSRTADARQETFAALAAALGAGPTIVSSILECVTTEAIVKILRRENLMQVLNIAAEKASVRASEYVRGDLAVGTALLSMKGEVLAADREARLIGRELGWRL